MISNKNVTCIKKKQEEEELGRSNSVQCGLKTVMMSTAIDPHLTVLCISKAGQHLRTTVRGSDLSARPGLKLPSGNPSNSSYVHSHIWKGSRTRGPQGVSPVMWARRNRAVHHFVRSSCSGKTPVITHCTRRDTILIMCVWISHFA